MPEKSARRPAPAAGTSSITSRVLELIASGQATSRAEIAAVLGAAPSTVSGAVGKLLEGGLVAEEGITSSTGGRPRKVLRLGGSGEFALAADVGGRHARIGVALPGGELSGAATIPFAIEDGPEEALPRLADTLEALAQEHTGRLRGVGLSLPGPVDVHSGAPTLPSRMPGWNHFPVAAWLEERFALPAVVENDANCMAVGEHAVRHTERRQSITVKIGSAIGAGVIVDGRLYRGATGAAGDITHVRIEAAGETPCSCGNTGCLETVASGAALVRILRAGGAPVDTLSDVVRLTVEADPQATRAVRLAGTYLGTVLSANVNFFNPDAVYLGGILSTLEPFVAAVRSRLYESCHPLVTKHLVIDSTRLGADAGVVGAGQFALQRAMELALQDITAGAPARTPRPRSPLRRGARHS